MLAGLVLVGTAMNKPQAPAAPQPLPAITPEPATIRTIANGASGVTLHRGADNHFYADALVNGAPIRFLVDTGASTVVLTQYDARRAGLGDGDYGVKAIGAGGELRLLPVRLTRLTMGPLIAESVPAMVAEQGRLPVSLLGQTFLRELDSVAIQGDTMILR